MRIEVIKTSASFLFVVMVVKIQETRLLKSLACRIVVDGRDGGVESGGVEDCFVESPLIDGVLFISSKPSSQSGLLRRRLRSF